MVKLSYNTCKASEDNEVDGLIKMISPMVHKKTGLLQMHCIMTDAPCESLYLENRFKTDLPITLLELWLHVVLSFLLSV